MLINNYMIIELRIIRVPVYKLLRSFRKKNRKKEKFHEAIIGKFSSPPKISSNITEIVFFERKLKLQLNLPNISRRHNIPTRTQHYLIITSTKQPIHNTIIIISNPLNRHNRNNKQTDISRDTKSSRDHRTSKETDSTPRPYRPKITDRAKDIYGHRYLKLLWLGKFKPILGATGALRLAIQAARRIHTNATRMHRCTSID